MKNIPYFMVTNRNAESDGWGSQRVDKLVCYTCPAKSAPTKASNWEKLDGGKLVKALQEIASTFPVIHDFNNEDQKHLSLFVHGYNNTWKESVERYRQLKSDLFEATDLGCPMLFSWPSNGSAAGYLPDREDARDSGTQTAELFVKLHDVVSVQERNAADADNLELQCRAKISVIAHSMGGYVVQKGLAVAAKRLNSPQLITLIHQLAMVAADVDNDIFQKEKPEDSDGSLMANLCYRIGALYTGLDEVLGASAGLKHFGTRRLGRSGLADGNSVWDNVFDWDVSDVIDRRKKIHSAVFDSPKSLALLEKILRGVDRHHLKD
ncbi:MAG: alpha/beta hydrolase [Lysobacter sp.]|nr:alpha/beta hydrolase [Lysobacter sp.]